MKHLILTLGLSLCTMASYSQEWTVENLETYQTFDEIEKIFQYENDTTYVINFWATWCGPCVKELPYFEDLHTKYEGKDPIKVVLVSLDFPKQVESKLIPFLNERDIKSEVLLLLDSKYNNWIDKVDPSWSGSIPITVFYNRNNRKFFEREFHSVEELIEQINFINN